MVSVEAIEKVRGYRDEFNPFWKWFRAEWVSQVTSFSREYRQALVEQEIQWQVFAEWEYGEIRRAVDAALARKLAAQEAVASEAATRESDGEGEGGAAKEAAAKKAAVGEAAAQQAAVKEAAAGEAAAKEAAASEAAAKEAALGRPVSP